MFGFDAKKAREEYEARQNDGYSGRRKTIEFSLAETFGTCDPQKLDKILREFMPETTNAILNTNSMTENMENHIIQQGKNQIAIADSVLAAIEELKKQNEEAMRKNQELQEKYNALVERMASVLENDRGKGR